MKKRSAFYRADIEGLRAVAIISVIINHFNTSLLPNGFLGVDIFFVISGFVITGSLINSQQRNLYEFITNFYIRRIKRILPALLVCTVISALLISLVDPDPQVTIKTGAAGILGFSNIYLSNLSINYFAASTNLNVFTQTWSLGVEEQFYLVYPLLFWVFLKNQKLQSKGFIALLIILSIISVAAFITFQDINPSAAFFLMPPRFWELCSGGILFVSLPKIKTFTENFNPDLIFLGMILILITAKLPLYLNTILIVIFTMLLIAANKPDSISNKLLTTRRMVFVGGISYSLYLWHWAIICLSLWTIGIHWWSVPLQVSLILLLAFISWKWIEIPDHFKQENNIIIASIFCIAFLQQPWLSRIYLGENKRAKNTTIPSCNIFEDKNKALKLGNTCGISRDLNRPNLYVVGDSHGWQFLDALKYFTAKHRYNLISVWGNACPFPAVLARGRYPALDRCFKTQKSLEFRLINKLKSGDIVLIANQLNAHFGGNWDMHWRRYSNDIKVYSTENKSLTLEQASALYRHYLMKLSTKLNLKGVRIIFYVDPPQFPEFEGGQTCSDQWFSPIWLRKECNSNKAIHEQRLNRFIGWLIPWQQQNIENRFIFNVSDLVECPQGVCTAKNFTDSNHLKQEYANYLWRKYLKSEQGMKFEKAVTAY